MSFHSLMNQACPDHPLVLTIVREPVEHVIFDLRSTICEDGACWHTKVQVVEGRIVTAFNFLFVKHDEEQTTITPGAVLLNDCHTDYELLDLMVAEAHKAKVPPTALQIAYNEIRYALDLRNGRLR